MTTALFGRLERDLQTLEEVELLADISPLASDTSEALPSPPLGPLTRRSQAITAFRKTVISMMDGVREIDLTSRLTNPHHDAQLRVVTAWRCSLAFAIGGTLAALAVFYIFERSFWRPLQTMRGVVEGIANRRYGEVIKAKGAPEIVEIFGSLSAIRERGKCSDDDREKEVEDRSKQKVRSERLAGIGLLATSVAHEINNPLTAIVGAADGLTWRLSDVASKLPADDAEIVREYLKMIVSESKRCRAITTKLLDFARGREGERALYDVTAIVSEVVGMFRHMREYSGRTVEMNRRDPVRAWCNGPEIKQVVLNLVANALQATPDGGRLDIRVSSSPDAVEVMFTDTGSGMSADTLEHIFDPFFSTKGPGAGTGLGLSISHAIVEKHHGALEAHSAGPGQGSTFRLRLPATENAAQVASRRAA
jgi:signal transduction histidine kinase